MLSYSELCRLVDDGVIRNLEPSQINGASIDVRIGQWVMAEREPDSSGRLESYFGTVADAATHRITLRNREPLAVVKHDLIRQPFVLMPGQFIIAQTLEEFWLPADIACEFKLKSSAARIGLNNLLAGHCDPGWHNAVLTLELQNCTRHHQIELRYGDAVGQMIFHRVTPVPKDKDYAARGRYNGDQMATGIKK